MADQIVEKLLKVESGAPPYHVGPTTNWYRNPDGPEAATLIQSQAARIAELEGVMAREAAMFSRWIALVDDEPNLKDGFAQSLLHGIRRGVTQAQQARSLLSEGEGTPCGDYAASGSVPTSGSDTPAAPGEVGP